MQSRIIVVRTGSSHPPPAVHAQGSPDTAQLLPGHLARQRRPGTSTPTADSSWSCQLASPTFVLAAFTVMLAGGKENIDDQDAALTTD